MKLLTKTILFTLAGSVILLGGYIGGTYAQRDRPAHGFLQSTSANIVLGVWDKADVDRTDHATFIVTSPTGKQYKAEKSQSLDEWVYVSFPNDFSEYPPNPYTLYSWKCIVGGKVVANGKFKWGNGRADDNNGNW